MHKAIDNSPTRAQLRRVDKWIGISLAALGVTTAILLIVLLAASTPARSAEAGELDAAFEGHYAQTTGVAPVRPSVVDIGTLLADPGVRDFKGLVENDWDFALPNVPGFGPPDVPSGFPPATGLLD